MFRARFNWTGAAALTAAGVLAVAMPAAAEQSDATARIREASAVMQRHIDLLKSPDQATRLAAFSEMATGKSAALRELAIETARASADPAMQALAMRAALQQVRSLVGKVQTSGTATGQAVVQACGDAVQYAIEGYSYDAGTFQVRGQDNAGVGNVNGKTLSLTIEYGCSLAATLQPDGSLTGIVSAPYKKGSLPVVVTFR